MPASGRTGCEPRAHGVPERRPGWRTRLLIAVARRFGTQLVLPTLNDLERGDSRGYDVQPESRGTAMPAEERSHARLLRSLSGGAGVEGAALGRLEGRHRAASGNALRAAVLGANDGLLSNFSLVMGVAGAQVSADTILVTGLAGLLAGAGSMAMGEWVSVQSARELAGHQLEIEAREIDEIPDEEREELALIYEAKGLDAAQARELAARQIADRSTALDTLAREELGIDPDELGGSAAVAAGTSFVLFAIGAILPVLPYFFLGGAAAVIVSAVLSVARALHDRRADHGVHRPRRAVLGRAAGPDRQRRRGAHLRCRARDRRRRRRMTAAARCGLTALAPTAVDVRLGTVVGAGD